MNDHPILDNRALSGRGSRDCESSDSSIPHDEDAVVADTSNRSNQTGSDHEGGGCGSMAVAGDQDNNPQVFRVYSGYGGSSYEYRSGYNTVSQIPDTAPGSAEQSSSVSVGGAAWTTMGRAASTVTEVLPSSSTRASLTAPREEGECGREHKPDSTDWGPGQRKGWNISTQPVYRSPSSPCNRLFSAIKETRPGREPKALLERLAYTPQPTTPRNYQPAHLRPGLESWNPSTAVTLYGTVTSPTHNRRKAHTSSETCSSVDFNSSSSPARRQLQHQKRKIIGHDPAPFKKAPGSAGEGNHGRQQQQQQRGSKLSKAFKEWKWNISTTPQWKATFKCNQFENIKDKKRSPRVDNKYTGVKAQYRKPSKKFLWMRKERQLEAQRREDYQALDMKLRPPGRLVSHEA